LLAILEADQLAPPDRSPDNRAYLDRRLRGWDARFRNIDDALFYQIGWIDSALFQSLYTQHVSAERRRLSFEWILLQALPDGAPLGYNHPDAVTLATIAYLGATSLDDPRYVWLAGRALDYLESHDGLVYNQPGVAQPIDLAGRTPTEGTSLLYG